MLSIPRMCDLKSDQIKRLWVASNIKPDQGKNYKRVQVTAEKTETVPLPFL